MTERELLPHCQSCGQLEGVECGSWEGYTSCCNERVVMSYTGDYYSNHCSQQGCSVHEICNNCGHASNHTTPCKEDYDGLPCNCGGKVVVT